MIDVQTPEIRFLIQAVRQASALAKQVQSEMIVQSLEKDDRSPVTVADLGCQALVAGLMARAFPGDRLVAEEDSSLLRQPSQEELLGQVVQFIDRFFHGVDPNTVCDWIDAGQAAPGGRFWTLDPIDGTKGFLRGDQYAIALALLEDGKVQVGGLGCPNLSDAYRIDTEGPGSLLVATRGQGTWLTQLSTPVEFEPVHVSSRSDPAQTRVLRSFEAGHTNVEQIDRLAQALGVQVEPVKMDSQAKYAVLAAGKGDLIIRLLSPKQPDYREKIWDQAAGTLVVEEAGGIVTDLDGQALDFTRGRTLSANRGLVATNGPLHRPVLNALREISA